MFPSVGFDQNRARDSGNVNGIRDLIATRPGKGIRQNLCTDAGLEKKTIFRIVMADKFAMRDSRETFPDPRYTSCST